MVDTSVFAAEVVQEVLEEMLIVRVCALYGCIGAQILVWEVDALSVHSRKFSIIKLKLEAQKNN